MLRMVLSLPLQLVILGSALSESGCWGAKNSGQAPTNPTPISVAAPPKADLYGVVKGVDSAQRTLTLRVEKNGEKPEETYAVAENALILLEGWGQLADLAAGSRVALVFDADGKTVREIRTEPFHILVTPQTNPIEVNKRFDVELRVVNASELPQSFHVLQYGWFRQWQSSNPNITRGFWSSYGDGIPKIELAPGETFTHTKFYPAKKFLWMQAKTVGLVTFRMGFTPVQNRSGFHGRPGKRTYWSNGITIEVNEDQVNK